jgi:hypothetical protein
MPAGLYILGVSRITLIEFKLTPTDESRVQDNSDQFSSVKFIIVGIIFGFNLRLDFQYLREICTHVKETQQLESIKLEQEQHEASNVSTNTRQ